MLRLLDPENNIVKNRKAFHKLKMLVYHADAETVGLVRVTDLHFPAVLFDHALLRRVQPEKDAHQRAFAGAVFTQKGMNLTPSKLERHVVIGLDAREFLRNVEHLNDIIFRHLCLPLPLILVIHRHVRDRGLYRGIIAAVYDQ